MPGTFGDSWLWQESHLQNVGALFSALIDTLESLSNEQTFIETSVDGNVPNLLPNAKVFLTVRFSLGKFSLRNKSSWDSQDAYKLQQPAVMFWGYRDGSETLFPKLSVSSS